MRFTSPFTLFDVLVLKEQIKRHPVTGDVIEVVPAVRATFGSPSAEYTYIDPDTGRTERGADITGGTFDTIVYQQETGCSDEVREAIERRLIRQSTMWPESCQLVSKPAAPKPWPKYDETHHNQVATLAETLGLVGEALAYEVENKNRETVVAKLTELQNAQQAAEPAEELSAA